MSSVCTCCSHRDIYYNDTQLFGSQTSVDSIVDDISCLLKVPRRALHVVCAPLCFLIRMIYVKLPSLKREADCLFHQLATSKGFISGDLCYMEEDGTRINCCSSQAVAISSNIGGIRSILGSVSKCPGQTYVRFS